VINDMMRALVFGFGACLGWNIARGASDVGAAFVRAMVKR
jgi:hypothetical protein